MRAAAVDVEMEIVETMMRLAMAGTTPFLFCRRKEEIARLLGEGSGISGFGVQGSGFLFAPFCNEGRKPSWGGPTRIKLESVSPSYREPIFTA